MLCPICAGEYQPLADLCPSCGCGLVSSTLRDEALSIEDRPTDFVELCRPSIYPVAMLIKQMLEQNGVGVAIQGGHSLSLLPHLAFGGELRLLVDSRQITFARAIYRAYFESEEGTNFTTDEG